MTNSDIIQISNLVVTFKGPKGTSLKAIDKVSLNIKSGEVLSLLGENGAGKSTLINAILGRIKPDFGSIEVFGQAPGSYSAKLRIGTILQSANLPDNTTVEEQINLFRSYYQAPLSLNEVLSIAMLKDLRSRKINMLSGGQKQRVFFALAICGQPDVIFLDEPTVGLDTNARREFWQCIEQFKQAGVAIVLTTHYLEEAEALSDQVVLLNQGRIVHQGTPEEIKAHALGKQVQFSWHHQQQSFANFLNHSGIKSQVSDVITQLTCQNQTVLFTTSNPEQVLKSLFAANAQLSDLTVTSTKLEDAVIALTSEQNNQNQAQQPSGEKAA